MEAGAEAVAPAFPVLGGAEAGLEAGAEAGMAAGGGAVFQRRNWFISSLPELIAFKMVPQESRLILEIRSNSIFSSCL